MAISKILNMKDCGGHFHGKHLKRSLDYVMNPEKTQYGRLVGAINCQAESAFEQMKETKRKFGKVDKRQGYHIILSFKEDEVNPDTAFEITQKFVAEYLGSCYEAVFVVHDNTAHVHSHIVFNSVSFVDGKKYRYEKGDWAKYIQPVTNRLCQEYGLSIIDVDDGNREKEHDGYKDWSEQRDANVWSDMIKRDLDACILQAGDYQQFLELLSDKGYEIKQGKYLSVKPLGMTRYRRCKTLGDAYSEEVIRERIVKEDLSFYSKQNSPQEAVLVRCRVKRYRRAKLSEKSRIYKARERSKELFEIADEMAELEPAEKSYSHGDTFFQEEHDRWQELEASLKAQGYSLEEVEELRKHYKEEYANACAKERAVFKELKIGQSIWDELIPDTVSDGKDTEHNKETIRDRKEQPVR